jgi:hypothetical protein
MSCSSGVNRTQLGVNRQAEYLGRDCGIASAPDAISATVKEHGNISVLDLTKNSSVCF